MRCLLVIQQSLWKQAQLANVPRIIFGTSAIDWWDNISVFWDSFSYSLGIRCIIFLFFFLEQFNFFFSFAMKLSADFLFFLSLVFISFSLVPYFFGFTRLWLHPFSFSCIFVLDHLLFLFCSFVTASFSLCVERSPSTAQSPSPLLRGRWRNLTP